MTDQNQLLREALREAREALAHCIGLYHLEHERITLSKIDSALAAQPAEGGVVAWRDLVAAVVNPDAGYIETFHGSWNSERTKCTACGATYFDGWVGGHEIDHKEGCMWVAKQAAIARLRQILATPPASQEQAQQPSGEVVAWREHVEQRIHSWRQSFVNKSGDQLALDDFMDKRSIDDLIDYVLDESTTPPASQGRPAAHQATKEPK